jgi:hypothetical protein
LRGECDQGFSPVEQRARKIWHLQTTKVDNNSHFIDLTLRITEPGTRWEDGMRRQLAIAALFYVVPVICVAQQSTYRLSDYAGTWQAKFQGTTFITINLVEKNGRLTGSASFGDIQADPSGAIKVVDAPAADSEWPIVRSRLLPSRGLEVTSHGDNETIIVVLKLINAKAGSVRFGNPPGGAFLVLKPIIMQKIEPHMLQ